jgi:cytochrome c2
MYRKSSLLSYFVCALAGVVVAGCGGDEPAGPRVIDKGDPIVTEDAGVEAPEPGDGDGDGDAPGDGDGRGDQGGDGDGDAPGDGDGDGDVDPGRGEDAGVGEDPDALEKAIMRGQEIAYDKVCFACHNTDFSGNGKDWPNITPDKATGIGSWTDQEIARAITQGIGKNGEALCSQMTRFALTDAEVADLIAFLRSLPPVSKAATGDCK